MDPLAKQLGRGVALTLLLTNRQNVAHKPGVMLIREEHSLAHVATGQDAREAPQRPIQKGAPKHDEENETDA